VHYMLHASIKSPASQGFLCNDANKSIQVTPKNGAPDASR